MIYLQLRNVYLDTDMNKKNRYPGNAINNCKYTWYSFVPMVLFNQFKYFFNLFFLLIALSQIIPALRVGFLISFVMPLVVVLAITMIKEFYDDLARYRKDTQINRQPYQQLNLQGGLIRNIESSKIKVGDLIILHPNERAPADMVLLWTSDPSGSLFIRTD